MLLSEEVLLFLIEAFEGQLEKLFNLQLVTYELKRPVLRASGSS